MSTHTPLPWEVRYDATGFAACIARVGYLPHISIGWKPDPHPTPQRAAQYKADGDYIVRAVNAHEELLAACKAVVAWQNAPGSHEVAWPGTLHDAIQLAKTACAKEETT